jgi:hypothetical protein
MIFEFTLNIAGVAIHSNEDLECVSDALYGGACADAFIGSVDEAMFIEFEREAESLQAAIIQAIKDVESTSGFELVVKSIDGDYVSLGEAANYLGVKKSTLSKYKKGNFGGGGFPSPARKASKKDPLWQLWEIAEWLYSKGKVDREALNGAKTISVINSILLTNQLKKESLYTNINQLFTK